MMKCDSLKNNTSSEQKYFSLDNIVAKIFNTTLIFLCKYLFWVQTGIVKILGNL